MTIVITRTAATAAKEKARRMAKPMKNLRYCPDCGARPGQVHMLPLRHGEMQCVRGAAAPVRMPESRSCVLEMAWTVTCRSLLRGDGHQHGRIPEDGRRPSLLH